MSETVESSHSWATVVPKTDVWTRLVDRVRILVALSPFFVMPVWIFPNCTDPTREGRFLVFDFVVCLLLVLEIFPSAYRYSRKWDLMHLPLLGLGVLFLVHLGVDPYLPEAFGRKLDGGIWLHYRYAFRYVVRYGAFLVWAALIVTGRFGPRFIIKAIDLTMLLAIPIAIYAILQNFGHELLEWSAAEERMRVMSTIGNALFLADYLAVVLIFYVGNLYRGRGRAWTILSCVAMPLLGVALYLTSSRGGVLALGGGLAVFVTIGLSRILSRRGWKRITLFAVAAIILLALFAVIITQIPATHAWTARFQEALSFSDFSLLSRLILWQACLWQWDSSPWIGVGMEQFRLRYLSVLRVVLQATPGAAAVIRTSKILAANEAHGDYVQVLAEWGIIGLALVTLLLVIGLTRSGTLALAVGGPWTGKEKRIAGVLFAALVAFCIEMLYGFQLRLPVHALLLFTCLAFATQLWHLPDRRREARSMSAWGWKSALGRVPLAVGAIGIALYALTVYRGETYGQVGRMLMATGHTMQGQQMTRKAHRLLPENGDFAFLYAVSLWEQNREQETVERLFDRAMLTSTNTRIPIAKGLFLMKTRRAQKAHRVLSEFAEFQASVEGLHHARGLVEYLSRDYQAAAGELETEVRLYPDNYEAYVYLAICYRLMNKTALAIETLEDALHVKSRGLEAHIQLSEIYHQQRMYKKAIREMREAISIANGLGDFRTATEMTVRLRQLRFEAEVD
jgi:O-antigen ligase/Tfp pilus assembly protein PilF